jgi:hypothetical protein
MTSELKSFNGKREKIQTDLRELENIFCPHLEERVSKIREQKLCLEEHYEHLTTEVAKQEDVWLRAIDDTVQKQKSDINEMRKQHLTTLENQEEELKLLLSEMQQRILDLREMLNSNNVALTSAYSSCNEKFEKFSGKELKFSLPTFTPNNIDENFVLKGFGFLTPLSITAEHQVPVQVQQPEADLPVLLKKPRLITTIETNLPNLHSVACVNDDHVWMSGDQIMRLFDLKKSFVKTIEKKSGHITDIAVTKRGDLIYSDRDLRTINRVKNGSKHVQEVIQLRKWTPYNICMTFSDDLLVSMDSNTKDSRVVRYHAFSETQIIQYDNARKPLFSANTGSHTEYSKYICENKNLDICVSDSRVRVVVVVNRAGKLKFRYSGHHSTTKKNKFSPVGIATDSQCHILIADMNSNRIHVLDHDGQFLRYIEDVDQICPWGLCVDSSDNLFVVECQKRQVRMIKYLDI